MESCSGGVVPSGAGGGRTTGGPTLLTELEDDEDGVLEEEEDNEENDQEVCSIPLYSSDRLLILVFAVVIEFLSLYRKKTRKTKKKAMVAKANMKR